MYGIVVVMQTEQYDCCENVLTNLILQLFSFITDSAGGGGNTASSSSSLGTGGGSGNIVRPSPGSNHGSLDRRSPAPNGPPPVAPKSTTPHSHHSHVAQHHGNTSESWIIISQALY